MLEALKSLTGGKSTQKSAEELEQLIATAREERGAMSRDAHVAANAQRQARAA